MSLRRMMLFTLGAKIKNLVSAFKIKVLADLALFESDSCLEAQLNTINNQKLLNRASLVVTPNAFKAGKLYSVVPSDGTGDFTVTRATSATRVNSLGLIETVGINVPRIDYTNAICPSILVEQQRTNLLLYSDMFSTSPAWSGVATIAPNTEIAPDNTLTADTLIDVSTSYQTKGQTVSVPINSTITASIFIKKTTGIVSYYPGISLVFSGGTQKVARVILDTTTGTFNLEGITTATASAKVISVNNYWKVELTATDNSSNNLVQFLLYPSFSLDGVTITPLAQGSNVFWGAQLELGGNATSYIPTTTATVTRNVDVIAKTSATDLIGQTEGTILVKGAQFNRGVVFRIRNNTNIGVNSLFIFCVGINGAVEVTVIKNGVSVGTAQPIPVNSVNKKNIIMVYSQNILKIFISGLLVYNYTYPTPTNFTTVLNTVEFGSLSENGIATFDLIALWKTTLTDTQAINLTTL